MITTCNLRVALLIVAFAPGPALGDVSNWVGYQYGPPQIPPTSASWFHCDQWFNYLVPDADDTAIFDTGFDPQGNGTPDTVYFGDYTVLADPPGVPNSFEVPGGDAVLGQLSIQRGHFTFRFSDDTGSPQGSLTVVDRLEVAGSESVSLTLEKGVVTAPGASLYSTVGTASIRLHHATLSTNIKGLFDIGVLGMRGAVFVGSDSLLQTGFLRVGENGGSNGLLEVVGVQARARINGAQIGATGAGRVEIRDGGQLHSTSNVVLANYGDTAQGDVIVSGAGSSLLVDYLVAIGDSGDGTLAIQSGAVVRSVEAIVANGSTSTSTVVVEGEGSIWDTQALTVGNNGVGTMTVRDHAMVSLEGLSLGGEGGVGHLTVERGGQLQVDPENDNGNEIFIGLSDSGVGEIVVRGAGSRLFGSTFVTVGGIYHTPTTGNGRLTIVDGGQVTNEGWGIVAEGNSSGTVTVSGSNSRWDISELLLLGPGGTGTLEVSAGGVVTAGAVGMAGAASSEAMASVSGTNSAIVAGTSLHIGDLGVASLTVSDFGVVTVINHLKIGARGTIDVDDQGVVNVGSGEAPLPGTLRVGPSGTLDGSGHIIGDVMVDGGIVSPGFSPGTLRIDGTYNQGPAGQLWIEIGGVTPGTQHDVLISSGAAVLSGMLNVSVSDLGSGAFQPQLGQNFDILSAGILIGTFDHYAFPALAANLRWDVRYSSDRVSLFIGSRCDFDGNLTCDLADLDALSLAAVGGDPATFDLDGNGLVDSGDIDRWLQLAGLQNLGAGRRYLPGDANFDAVVDGADFGIWNASKFTSTGRWSQGDFNADGMIDGSDFGIWNANKFTSSFQTVPEPSCLVLLTYLLAVSSLVPTRPRLSTGGPSNKPMYESSAMRLSRVLR
jgi:T5SS/PEP-CTERM-associated repeat protein